ncbi:hypothetical protein R3P38DRAFT_3575367 [Favolaschia claudopus]|uniref:Uncharacterized protein n=1 Tax=Favolaschia claudopus TaxID=2862362 RepID=A0AAW0ALR8_9AGAR
MPSPSYIDAARLSLKALHHFTDLRIYPETVDACPDLWARVWPWMQFFDTYWEYIPGFLPSEYGMTRLIHCFVVANFQRSDPVREISAVLPGLHLIFSRAWITLVLDPSSNQSKLFLQTVYLVPNVSLRSRTCFRCRTFRLSV